MFPFCGWCVAFVGIRREAASIKFRTSSSPVLTGLSVGGLGGGIDPKEGGGGGALG